MEVWDGSGAAMLVSLGDMELASGVSMQAAKENADSAQSSATMMTVIIAIIAALVAVALGLWLSTTISRGINAIRQALQKMATGDLQGAVSKFRLEGNGAS